jgi:hypothetical protein
MDNASRSAEGRKTLSKAHPGIVNVHNVQLEGKRRVGSAANEGLPPNIQKVIEYF